MSGVVIAEMRSRLALEAPLETGDGGGGLARTWSLVAEVWGALKPVSGTESFVADGVHGRVSHEVWIRFRSGVTPDMRFVLGARIFEIRAVIDSGARHRFLRCLAEERVS